MHYLSNSLHFCDFIFKTNGDDEHRKEVIRNRNTINVLFLLDLYIIAIVMKTNQMADFETGCNLPVIRLALDDTQDMFLEQHEFDIMREELQKEPNSFANRINKLTDKFVSNHKEANNPHTRNPRRVLNIKQKILSRLHEEAKELTSLIFYRLNEIIYLSNTRHPRIMTLYEALEFDSIKLWLLNLLQLLPDGESERLQREFLTRSTLVSK